MHVVNFTLLHTVMYHSFHGCSIDSESKVGMPHDRNDKIWIFIDNTTTVGTWLRCAVYHAICFCIVVSVQLLVSYKYPHNERKGKSHKSEIVFQYQVFIYMLQSCVYCNIFLSYIASQIDMLCV